MLGSEVIDEDLLLKKWEGSHNDFRHFLKNTE